jgi:hypothetical protein
MSNYPAPRDVPANKVLIAEARDMNSGNRTVVETIAVAMPHADFPGRHNIPDGIKLQWSSPGFELAGAAMRWTNGYWAVRWFDRYDNVYRGQRYAPDAEGETKARAHFARLTGAEAPQ